MNDFEVRGGEALSDIAKALKKHADGSELRKQLLREIRAAGKPMVADIKTNLRTGLPQRGGLAKEVSSKIKVATRNRLSGEQAGVRIEIAKKGTDLESIDEGKVRHPVHGNRKRWVSQKVKPSLVTGAVDDHKPAMQEAVLDAMEAALDSLIGDM